MKIFDPVNSVWRTKVNFVDQNNVVVGYDMGRDCCEEFGWTIRATQEYAVTDESGTILDAEDLGPYVFDTDTMPITATKDDGPDDVTASAHFRLVAPSRPEWPEMWLTLWNCHNGYYSHGWEQKRGEVRLTEGIL